METKRVRREPVHLTNTNVKAMEPGEKYFDVPDDEVTGFRVRVMPNGSKIYHVRYTMPDGSQNNMRIGDAGSVTASAARDAAKRHWADAVRGDDPMAVKQAPRAYTLEKFLDEVYKPRATHRTATNTVERVKASFKDLLPKPLAEIRPMWIESWRKGRLEDGKTKSTTNRDLDALRGVLSRAMDWGFIEDHPLKRVKKFKLDQGAKPRFLDAEELKRLHDAMDARELKMQGKRARFNKWRAGRSMSTFTDLSALPFADYLKPMTLLALNTGLRRGEIFGLRWENVNIEGDSPSVEVHGEIAKSGRTRHVPLNAVALDTLRRWKAQTGGEGLVFQSPKGGGQFGHIRRSWTDLMKDAKLPDFRFHDCRHHFASMLVQRGVDLNIVRELLGHSDLKLTLRYAHLAPANAAAAVRLLDAPANVIQFEKEAEG